MSHTWSPAGKQGGDHGQTSSPDHPDQRDGVTEPQEGKRRPQGRAQPPPAAPLKRTSCQQLRAPAGRRARAGRAGVVKGEAGWRPRSS